VRTPLAYLDMFSGVAGDMLVAALVDAGLDADRLRSGLAGLDLPPFELEVREVARGTLAATHVGWRVPEFTDGRRLPEIERIVRGGGLPPAVTERAVAVFRRLAGAEARVHGVAPSDVHFHEVGALDAILDVCGALLGFHLLGVSRVDASPFRLGTGYVRAAHGRLPVPAPAVPFLLEGWRTEPLDVAGELTTPTGAAIVTTLAHPPGGGPRMRVARVGHGAGTRDAADPPNVLRVLLGEPAGRAAGTGPAGGGPNADAGAAAPADGGAGALRSAALEPGVVEEDLRLLETTIDDLNPQLYVPLEERLRRAGALEVHLVAAWVKGRPGTLVRCLARRGEADALERVLFAETTTLGVRAWDVRRRALPRREETVETSFGPVRAKRVLGADGAEELRPEFAECRRLADAAGLPVREVARRLAGELAGRADGPARAAAGRAGDGASCELADPPGTG
jgi:uncharacterized protein (TIGR00299 family) protein